MKNLNDEYYCKVMVGLAREYYYPCQTTRKLLAETKTKKYDWSKNILESSTKRLWEIATGDPRKKKPEN